MDGDYGWAISLQLLSQDIPYINRKTQLHLSK